MSPNWLRITTGVSILALLLSVAVFGVRGRAVMTAVHTAPGVAVTSGYEEESLFAVWRAAHGQPVYADATQLPFASAYFNWLFYTVYAGPVKVAAAVWGDASLPAVARLVTAIAAVLGALALGRLLRDILGGTTWPAAALASFAFAGPLVGWWSFTTRPDLGALVFETLAVGVLLRGWRVRPLKTALLTALLCYGAWACKSTYVAGLGAVLVFLVWRRQWRAAFVLTVVSGVLWAGTFAAMGPGYRAAFASTARTNLYFLGEGITNFKDMAAKTAPLWLLAAGLAVTRPRRDATASPLGADATMFGALGLVVTLTLNFAGSCKLGAASYYFFPSLLMLVVLIGGLAAGRPGSRVFPVGLALVAALQLLVLSGHAGRTNLANQTVPLSATWAAWQKEPAPRFASLTSLNLPWLNRDSPPLVLAFNYGLERSLGHPFERNGVGGMINEGYFRSLLLPADTADSYDGASLQRYVRGETVGEFAIFRLRADSKP